MHLHMREEFQRRYAALNNMAEDHPSFDAIVLAKGQPQGDFYYKNFTINEAAKYYYVGFYAGKADTLNKQESI